MNVVREGHGQFAPRQIASNTRSARAAVSAGELLGPGGPLARRLQGYEPRDGQQQVATAVADLLANDGVLLCEAGTGIGKTFAYLIPALLSGRKVIVSTATRTLQDQIAGRDLPAALSAIGRNIDTAVMKGLGNYLCRRRHREFQLSEEALRPQYASPLRLLEDFQAHSESGDLSELAGLSERSPLRAHIASSSDTRRGQSCGYFNECFVTQMKQHAERAQLVVVNHHLFFADLALRGPHPGRVLPEYDCVIFDEAHQLEDTAALFFGVRLSSSQISRICAEASRLIPRPRHLTSDVDKAFLELGQALQEIHGSGRTLIAQQTLENRLAEQVATFDARLDDLAQALQSRASAEGDAQQRETLEQLARRVQSQRETFEQIRADDPRKVTWMELSSGNLLLSSTPVDLSGILKSRLFDEVPAVGLLSATLRTSGGATDSGFSYVRSRLGIGKHEACKQLSVESPFDYPANCLLYLPRDLPPPSAPTFVEQAGRRIAELIELSDGGAFVLTTSVQSMRSLHAQLKQRLGSRPLWIQGERPKEVLLSAFRANKTGVLVATSSFWEGVDVPGDALRLLILEKIPFSVPTDPIFQARSQALEAAGRSPFMDLALPEAAIRLKQGFGRLIRRQSDRGVVVVLDERLQSKGYGKRLLSALPPARRVDDLTEVGKFFQARVSSARE